MARPLKDKEEDKTIIKQIMREKGITVDALAKKMHKAKTTVSIQLNKNNMTISTLKDIASALGVEISDLFPVKPGYVHYLEAKNIAMGIRQEQPQVVADKDVALFEKFKAFMAQEQCKDESLLVNNPAFTL